MLLIWPPGCGSFTDSSCQIVSLRFAITTAKTIFQKRIMNSLGVPPPRLALFTAMGSCKFNALKTGLGVGAVRGNER